MLKQRLHLDLFADYFQFYIQDESVAGDLSESWSQEATDRMLAITDGTIGVGTARNMTVPVDIELHDSPPVCAFESWDQVNECSIEVKSGHLVAAGCTDYFPDAVRIKVSPGMYRARILYGKLGALSENGLDGDDHYLIQLWSADSSLLLVLKSRSAG